MVQCSNHEKLDYREYPPGMFLLRNTWTITMFDYSIIPSMHWKRFWQVEAALQRSRSLHVLRSVQCDATTPQRIRHPWNAVVH